MGKLADAKEVLQRYNEGPPNGAAGLYLLGKVYRLMGSLAVAREMYSRALALDPLLWSAYEELCICGGHLEAGAVVDAVAMTAANISAPPQAGAAWSSGAGATTPHAGAPAAVSALAGNGMPLFGPMQFATPASQGGGGLFATPMGPAAATTTTAPTAPAATNSFTFNPHAQPFEASGLDSASESEAMGQPGAVTSMFTPAAADAGAMLPAPPVKQQYQQGYHQQGYHQQGYQQSYRQPPGVGMYHTGQGEGAGQPYQQQPQLVPFHLPPSTFSVDFTPGAMPPPPPRPGRHDDGRPRKVTGKLFNDPASVSRRSSRLAHLGNTSASAAGPSPFPNGSFGGPTVAAAGASSGRPDGVFAFVAGAGGAAGIVGTEHAQAMYQMQAHMTQQALEGQHAASARAELLHLLLPIYSGYRHLANYECNEAIQQFGRLNPLQYRTAWVLCQVGRAYFEKADYTRAATCFEDARIQDRHRVENMEVYSTVLWHLKKAAPLSYLAQEMVALDRLAPQTWCVAGNFFSLQRDHDSAVEFFSRAVQLEPTFTYAYTLSGHELAAAEELDKAMACFRAAHKLEPRHYNAVYGMGQIFFKAEKYDLAFSHFKMAATIHPRSSTLHCYAAMALHKLDEPQQALDKLQEALDLDPLNPLVHHERAAVLLSLDRPEESLAALQQLNQLAPGEASVAFQLGKLHKRLGNLMAAQHAFELALSYNATSADAGLIKAAIEKLDLGDEAAEEGM